MLSSNMENVDDKNSIVTEELQLVVKRPRGRPINPNSKRYHKVKVEGLSSGRPRIYETDNELVRKSMSNRQYYEIKKEQLKITREAKLLAKKEEALKNPKPEQKSKRLPKIKPEPKQRGRPKRTEPKPPPRPRGRPRLLEPKPKLSPKKRGRPRLPEPKDKPEPRPVGRPRKIIIP